MCNISDYSASAKAYPKNVSSCVPIWRGSGGVGMMICFAAITAFCVLEAVFRLSLLSSISVIISGFSFCLRRGTFVGRKYPKASAFLKESSQRTKNIFPCCPSPVSLSRRCSEFSMVVLPRLRRPACAFAPRTPCFILLAPFYQRIRLAGIRR